MSNKSSDTAEPRKSTRSESASGRFVDGVKKDIRESVDLYFRPMKVLAEEFTKATATRQKRRHSPAR